MSFDVQVQLLSDFLRWLSEPPKNSKPLLTIGRRAVLASFLLGVPRFAGMNQDQLCRKYWISRRQFESVRKDLSQLGILKGDGCGGIYGL